MDASSQNEQKRKRPIACKEVTVKNAFTFILLCSIVGLSLLYTINIITFLTGFSFWIIFMMYSFPWIRLKSKFIVKSLVTSTGPSFTLLLGASSVLNGFNPMVLFAAFVQASFMFFVLPALADTFDIHEDTQFGMKTLAMVLSWKQKSKMMLFAPITVIIATLISTHYLDFNIVSSVFVILSSLLLLKEMSNIPDYYNEPIARKIRKFCFVYFTFLPVLITTGILNLDKLITI